MAKLTAWLVTLVGILLVLLNIPAVANALAMNRWVGWVISLIVLGIGITKLMRNYEKKKKRK